MALSGHRMAHQKKFMSRCVWVVAWLCVSLSASILIAEPASQPKPVPQPKIVGVEFKGLSQMAKSVARDLAGIKVGDLYDTKIGDAAVMRLLRSGRFLTAKHSIREENDGVVVVFEVSERSIITAIRFDGNKKFSDTKLREEVGTRIGQAVDSLAIRADRDSITEVYNEAGYRDVKVTCDVGSARKTGELVYIIIEGDQVKIREVAYEGNVAFDAHTLKGHVTTKPAFWIFRSGAFDPIKAEADTAALQKFYRDQGYLDARVKYRVEALQRNTDLRIVFTIDEGERYVIETLRFSGQSVFGVVDLKAMVGSKAGQFVDRVLIGRDAKAIKSRYGELGFINVVVRPLRVFSEKPGLTHVTFQIEEGEQFRVGRVVVRGNVRTRDKVVRRELNLYPPDDWFDLNAVREAERRLVESRVFSGARVIPVGDQPGVRDAIIDVREADKLGDFIFGVGVTSNSGLIGSVVLDLQNFDIKDRPRSLSELFKFQSFWGGGQKMRIQLEPGTNLNRFRIDFTEPYFRDEHKRLDVSAFLFGRRRIGYSEQRNGLSLSLGQRLDRGLMRGWTGELAVRVENVTLGDYQGLVASEIRDDRGNTFLTSLKGSLVRDRTDSRFVPTIGDRLRVSYEQFGILGGDLSFGRLNASYTHYTTVRVDEQDRKSVLKLRGDGGVIIGNAPVFERYFAGGTGSMRGFAFRGVGPHEGLKDDNIGGDFLMLLGSEYSFPVYGQNLRGHVFMDTGTAGAGTYRASVGVGIRFNINIFKQVPIELNLAMPISRDGEDNTQVFSFVFGGLF